MSNQENKLNNSNTNASKDKGKSKSISAISNSVTLLGETLTPSSTTTTLNSLLQQINNQKPQNSSSTTTFLQEEWQNNFFQQRNNLNNTINNNYNIRSNNELGALDTDWEQWVPSCPSAKSTNSSHIYPFHHHYPHKTNYEITEDENEILEFLNSNNYTDQIYNEDLNQLTSNRQKDYDFLKEYQNSKFVEEFLESKDIQEYLLKISYTNDIYGIPIFLKELIIEAKNELNHQNIQDDDKTLKHQKTAIERLKMVRDHLIKKRNLDNNSNVENNNE